MRSENPLVERDFAAFLPTELRSRSQVSHLPQDFCYHSLRQRRTALHCPILIARTSLRLGSPIELHSACPSSVPSRSSFWRLPLSRHRAPAAGSVDPGESRAQFPPMRVRIPSLIQS